MPLPRKENKVTRISQIVADLPSPKRGGSLVVETGFPTSLIDLFVKNRSRFKKNRVEVCIERRYKEAPSERRLVRENIYEDDEVAESGQDLSGVGECAGGSDANMIHVSMLKILVVVVLTLSVKKLTFGITMSAFVLLFLEYVGKRIVCCLNLKPCSNANVPFRYLSRRVFSSFLFQQIAFQMRKNCEGSEPAFVREEAVVSGLVGGVELSSASSSIEEIKIVEAKARRIFLAKRQVLQGLNSVLSTETRNGFIQKWRRIQRGRLWSSLKFLKQQLRVTAVLNLNPR